jgi:hypothetical protein
MLSLKNLFKPPQEDGDSEVQNKEEDPRFLRVKKWFKGKRKSSKAVARNSFTTINLKDLQTAVTPMNK